MPANGGSMKGGSTSAIERGKRMYNDDMPDGLIRRAVRDAGEYNVASIAQSALPYGYTPRTIGTNRYTGTRDMREATREASTAYRNALYQAGGYRAGGRSTPNPAAIRKEIARLFDVPVRDIRE